jgi:hypothetical protein
MLDELPLDPLTWDDQTKRLFFIDPDTEPTIDLFLSRVHPEDREKTRKRSKKPFATTPFMISNIGR